MYSKPTERQTSDMLMVKTYLDNVRSILSYYGSRRASVALTQLETAELWANKAIVKGDAND